MTQNLNHYEKILSRSHSNYLAQISIEMTDANNQINDVLSKLTALGTVLIPMNLVTGQLSNNFFFGFVLFNSMHIVRTLGYECPRSGSRC
jgi:Mg2+ and Co2+ transporter CorA